MVSESSSSIFSSVNCFARTPDRYRCASSGAIPDNGSRIVRATYSGAVGCAIAARISKKLCASGNSNNFKFPADATGIPKSASTRIALFTWAFFGTRIAHSLGSIPPPAGGSISSLISRPAAMISSRGYSDSTKCTGRSPSRWPINFASTIELLSSSSAASKIICVER